MMNDERYIETLEERLAIMRQNYTLAADEAKLYREKYEGVEHRIAALEMIVAQAEVRMEPPVGRTLWVAVTLNEELILQNKDNEVLAELTIQDAWKRLAFELKGALIEGRLTGARIPMLRKAKWTDFSDVH